MSYNVAYRHEGAERIYCLQNSDLATAERTLAAFKTRYENTDGTPKAYPNGKGFYAFSNPRIVRYVWELGYWEDVS